MLCLLCQLKIIHNKFNLISLVMEPNPLLKIEFQRRLVNVIRNAQKCLETGSVDKGLMPALYSLFSYMWCKRSEDLYNKNNIRCQK